MDDLMHYGVLGMKWGIKKTRADLKDNKPKDRRKKEEKRATEHEDYKKAHNKKPVSEMSDKELRERLNRINMEQQYKNLNPSKLNKGYKAVKTALAVAGTAIAIKNTYDQIRQWFPVSGVDIDLK